MKFFTLTLFLFSSSYFNQNTSWVEMRDLSDRFIISFPIAPEYKQQELTTELGKVENETFYVNGLKDHPIDTYFFNVLSYSYEIVDIKDDEEVEIILQNTILDLATNNKMETTYVKLDRDEERGHPFAEVRYANKKSKKVMRAKIFLYRTRMIVMQVYMSDAQSLNENIDYYFRSYKNLM